jgi:pyruvate dehydrogenase E2 component (dihydrolipoamide acetyltransferase)
MAWKIGMPNLGHTMESGTVAEWHKNVGDSVKAGDIIGAVESDKATFDIEAPADGVLLAIYIEAGTEIPIGTTLALVGAVGEATALEEKPIIEKSSESPVVSKEGEPHSSPRIARPKASPAARAMAEELGVDLADVTGTGDEDLISKEDVEAAAADSKPKVEKKSSMRRAIADATSHAWTTIPHVALTSHADIPSRPASSSGGLTSAIVRAAALALQDHTALNGWFSDDRFTAHDSSDVGVVISLPGGLTSVTINAAHKKSEDDIAKEIAENADLARTGKLKGEQTTGASFSLSSLGRWGVDHFSPIISAPQVAILGVGRVNRAAREDTQGGVFFVDQLSLTLVFDHRANDGVAAAECLASIVRYLEDPALMENIT